MSRNDTNTTDTNTTATMSDPAADAPRRRLTFTKLVLVVICLALVAMWVYAFGFAPKKAAYRVDDAAWRSRAQDICARYETERLKLVDTEAGYIAEPTEAQMIERADIVDAATDIMAAGLAEVIAVLPASERDRSLVSQYHGYYNTLLADRRRYTAQLRQLVVRPYTETVVDRSPVTNVITDFAIVNEMRACTPPGELGGDV